MAQVWGRLANNRINRNLHIYFVVTGIQSSYLWWSDGCLCKAISYLLGSIYRFIKVFVAEGDVKIPISLFNPAQHLLYIAATRPYVLTTSGTFAFGFWNRRSCRHDGISNSCYSGIASEIRGTYFISVGFFLTNGYLKHFMWKWNRIAQFHDIAGANLFYMRLHHGDIMHRD